MIFRRKISFFLHCSNRLQITLFLHEHITNTKIRSFCDKLFIPFGILFYFLKKNRAYKVDEKKINFKYKISIVCIVKNEGTYLREWLKYHISCGVEHFYIYDNDSEDNTYSVLREFNDYVTYTRISGKVRQLDAYNDALNRFSLESELLAVIDADEFLYSPLGNHNVCSAVAPYFQNKSVGGFVVNWLIYGSSNFEKRPYGLVTDNFLYRSKIDFSKNHFVKTICNPRKVFNFTISHAANYFPRFYAINEKQELVNWASTDTVNISTIRLNHYYSKSKMEFLKKRDRGSGEVAQLRNISEFEEHNKNDIFDDSLKRYNLKHGLSN